MGREFKFFRGILFFHRSGTRPFLLKFFLLPILMVLVHCCIDYFLLWQTIRPSLAKAGRKRSIWRPPFVSGCLLSIFYFENLIQRGREYSGKSSSFDKTAIKRVGLRLILSLCHWSSVGCISRVELCANNANVVGSTATLAFFQKWCTEGVTLYYDVHNWFVWQTKAAWTLGITSTVIDLTRLNRFSGSSCAKFLLSCRLCWVCNMAASHRLFAERLHSHAKIMLLQRLELLSFAFLCRYWLIITTH